MTFRSNRLTWPTTRTGRRFRVHVIEPSLYDPPCHAAIFNAAITALIQPAVPELSAAGGGQPLPPVPFNLATFPEAFLPSADLVLALQTVATLDACGCVHVGLRPDDTKRHLFSPGQLNELVAQLRAIPNLEQDDLADFCGWLEQQSTTALFNVGCLFAIDASGKLRICLHPKVVRSKFEVGMEHEATMTEANLLTLVTLQPVDRRYLSVTIQPLLCSDALNLATDQPNARPLPAITADNGACFAELCPDQIDLVSLATCTPQPDYSKGGMSYSQWHPEFQETFRRAVSDDELLKHHHCVFVLSNFRMLEDGRRGGLSGGFIPVPFLHVPVPTFIRVSVYGHPAGDHAPDEWSNPTHSIGPKTKWKNEGYIAALENGSEPILARMIAFTIDRFPREASRWKDNYGLTDFRLFTEGVNSEDGAPTLQAQV